jgi:hypothetical protein
VAFLAALVASPVILLKEQIPLLNEAS